MHSTPAHFTLVCSGNSTRNSMRVALRGELLKSDLKLINIYIVSIRLANGIIVILVAVKADAPVNDFNPP